MTATLTSPSIRQIARLGFVIVLGLAAVAGAKAAPAPFGIQITCSPDAGHVCLGDTLDAGRVRPCLLDKKANLNAGCRLIGG